jgi:hypothetical protein
MVGMAVRHAGLPPTMGKLLLTSVAALVDAEPVRSGSVSDMAVVVTGSPAPVVAAGSGCR